MEIKNLFFSRKYLEVFSQPSLLYQATVAAAEEVTVVAAAAVATMITTIGIDQSQPWTRIDPDTHCIFGKKINSKLLLENFYVY